MNLVQTYLVRFPKANSSPARPQTVIPGSPQSTVEAGRRAAEAAEAQKRREAAERRRVEEARQRAAAARTEEASRQKAEALRLEEARRVATERQESQRRAEAAREVAERRAEVAQRELQRLRAQLRRGAAQQAQRPSAPRAASLENLSERREAGYDSGFQSPYNETDDTAWQSSELEESTDPFAEETPVADWNDTFGSESSALMAQTLQQTALQLEDAYGPVTQMGQNLRIQAAKGYRAGVMRLRNGMYLVVEIHESALDPQFGAASVLVPLAINAAARALQNEKVQSAAAHTASEGLEAAGRGFSRLGRGRRQTQPSAPYPYALAYPTWPSSPYPTYPAGYIPYPPPAPYHLLPPVKPTQPALQVALPWADGQDVARIEGWDSSLN